MRHCFPSLTLTLAMADLSLASTAVFAVSTMKLERNKLEANRRRNKARRETAEPKTRVQNAVQRPNSATIWISGVSTARQVDHQGISNRSPSPLDLGCPRSTSSYQQR